MAAEEITALNALGNLACTRGSCCPVANARFVYAVGSRVAIADKVSGQTFLPISQVAPAERIQQITALAADASGRYICCCYVIYGCPNDAHAAVYHLSTSTDSWTGKVKHCRSEGAVMKPTAMTSSASSIASDVATGLRCCFIACSFSADSRSLLTLTNGPHYSLIGYDWRGGGSARLFQKDLGFPLQRAAVSPFNSRKIATCGAGGSSTQRGHFQLWRAAGTDLVPVGAQPEGLAASKCYTDVCWLAPDRLAVTTAEGGVAVVGPTEVLQYWDSEQLALGGLALRTLCAHPQGFVAGSDGGWLLAFSCTDSKYALHKAACVCAGADIVDLQCSEAPAHSRFLLVHSCGAVGQVDAAAVLPIVGRAALNTISTGAAATAGESTVPVTGSFGAALDAFQATLAAVSAAAAAAAQDGASVADSLSTASAAQLSRASAGGSSAVAVTQSVAAPALYTVCLARAWSAADSVSQQQAVCCKLAQATRKPLLAVLSASKETTAPAELLLWDYRSKELVLRHIFLASAAESTNGATIAPSGDSPQAASDSTGPHCVAVHPDGHCVALGFSNLVALYFVAATCSVPAPPPQQQQQQQQQQGSSSEGDSSSSSSSSSAAAVVEAAVSCMSVADGQEMELRADQEVLTCGVFRAPGEDESCMNDDPVTELEFSNGGHLLAAVTGRLVQIMATHAPRANGGFARVQCLSGHTAAITAVRWASDDRRLWTTAADCCWEWEVGSGATGKAARRVECAAAGFCFDALSSGIGLRGGVIAAGMIEGQTGRRRAKNRERALDAASTAGDSVASTMTTNTLSTGTRSTLMLWPHTLAAPTAAAAAAAVVVPFEAEVPHHITRLAVISSTEDADAAASGSPFLITYSATSSGSTSSSSSGAASWVLAGTAQGLVVAYDYSKLRSGSLATAAAAAAAPVAELCLHAGPVTALLAAHDRAHFFSAAADGSVFMCRLRGPRRRRLHAAARGASQQQLQQQQQQQRSSRELSAADEGTGVHGEDVKQHIASSSSGKSAAAAAARDAVASSLVLMDAAAARRLREQVLEAVGQAEQQSQSTRFSLERQAGEHQKQVAALEAKHAVELKSAEARAAHDKADAVSTARTAQAAAAEGQKKHSKELQAMEAAYERRQAAQVEAYMTLSAAFEELASAAAGTASEAKAKAEAAEAGFEETKKAEVAKLLEEQHTLRDYVAFLRHQYEAALAEEEKLRESERERAAAAIAAVEAEAVAKVESVRAETLNTRKDLRVATRRIEEHGLREARLKESAEAAMTLAEVQKARAQSLENEVAAREKRLGEWEVIADRQRGASRDLGKLREALTAQLQEQRVQLETKDAQILKLKSRLDNSDALYEKGVREVEALDTAARAHAKTARRLKQQLEASEAAAAKHRTTVHAAVTAAANALAEAKDKHFFVHCKAAAEAALEPLLKAPQRPKSSVSESGITADSTDDTDAGLDEAERQRNRMREGLEQASRALRQGKADAARGAAIRVEENAELTTELNALRRTNKLLEHEARRLRADSMYTAELLRQATAPAATTATASNTPRSTQQQQQQQLLSPIHPSSHSSSAPQLASYKNTPLQSRNGLAAVLDAAEQTPWLRPSTSATSGRHSSGGTAATKRKKHAAAAVAAAAAAAATTPAGSGARSKHFQRAEARIIESGGLATAAAAAKVEAAERRAALAEAQAEALLRESRHAAAALEISARQTDDARAVTRQLQRKLQFMASNAAMAAPRHSIGMAAGAGDFSGAAEASLSAGAIDGQSDSEEDEYDD